MINDNIVYLFGLGVVNFHCFPEWFDQIDSVKVTDRQLTVKAKANSLIYRILRQPRYHTDHSLYGLDGMLLQGGQQRIGGVVNVYPDGTYVMLATVEYVKYAGTKRETFYYGNCQTVPRKPLNFVPPPGVETFDIVQPQDFGSFYNPVHWIVITGSKFAEIPKFYYIDKPPFNIIADDDTEYVLLTTDKDTYAASATECIKFREIGDFLAVGPTDMFAKRIPGNPLIYQIGDVFLERVGDVYSELGYNVGTGRFTKASSSYFD